MEGKLFEAAYVGDIQYVKEISEQLNVIVTPKKNTILHINIAFGRSSTSFVDRVLEICPPLLNQVSDNGDTPLHLAAKAGLVHIAEVLIKHAKAHSEGLECGLSAVKQMLRMTNNDGNTALHEAAQHLDSANVVKLLMREDPDFPHDSANNCSETPLYIAASRGCLEIVAVMLETCTSATYNYKDPCGMTILHAAVRRNHLDITRKILEKSGTKMLNENGRSLTKETDESGWTPLHYAAYYDHHFIVKLLVKFDVSAAYITDKCRKMTPLHLAAGQGHSDIARTIIISHHACVEQVDERGWNFVHFHMCSLTAPGLWSYSLFDAKDVRGNTPLFVLASISPQYYGSINDVMRKKYADRTMHNIRDLEGQSDQLKNEVLELSKVRDKPHKLGVVRLPQKTDSCGLWSNLAKSKDIYLVVNALIATVTFTAGLTLPGGYIQEGSNKGTPILIGNLAFQAFVISNAIALVLSILAVCLHLCWQFHRLKKHLFLIMYAHVFTILALVATSFAFVAGTYAMLRPYSRLAVTAVMIVLGPVWELSKRAYFGFYKPEVILFKCLDWISK